MPASIGSDAFHRPSPSRSFSGVTSASQALKSPATCTVRGLSTQLRTSSVNVCVFSCATFVSTSSAGGRSGVVTTADRFGSSSPLSSSATTPTMPSNTAAAAPPMSSVFLFTAGRAAAGAGPTAAVRLTGTV